MTNRNIETVGFIGLGVMGEAMCRNLIKSGRWSVVAFDLKAEPLDRISNAGAKAAKSVIELAQGSEAIITCLPGGDEVRQLVFGQSELMNHLRAGQILIDMSTSQSRYVGEGDQGQPPRVGPPCRLGRGRSKTIPVQKAREKTAGLRR